MSPNPPITPEALRALELTALPPMNPILPLHSPPPTSNSPPVLPPRLDAAHPFGATLPEWKCDTFVIPAAYPRSVPGSVRSKDERARGPRSFPKDVWEATVEMVTRQVESSFINPGYQGDNSEEPLFQVVNRYSPRASRTVADGAPKTSLVLIHGTMLCKELWEPTIADLLAEGEVLDEVWALDTYNSGQSSLVNQDLLGYTLAWEDYGRDIVAFLRSPIFQQSPESGINPTLHHHRPRKVLGVGHSFGGTALLFSAAMDPSLFTSIILLEPVAAFGEWSAAEHASRSLKRRSEWPSREAAREQWLASPRFQRWDPRSFDRYVRFGLLEKDDGTVTLSTKKEDEAVQFASPNGYGAELATKVFSTLPSTLPVTVLYADHPGSLAPDVALESLRAANPRARMWRMPGMTHFMVEETPGRLARELSLVWRDTDSAKM